MEMQITINLSHIFRKCFCACNGSLVASQAMFSYITKYVFVCIRYVPKYNYRRKQKENEINCNFNYLVLDNTA